MLRSKSVMRPPQPLALTYPCVIQQREVPNLLTAEYFQVGCTNVARGPKLILTWQHV